MIFFSQFMIGSVAQTDLNDSGCVYYIHGILTSSKVNGLAPNIFTRVYPFLDWIESIVWPG